jgi:DNA-binding winged helix-turn-helix (wHTH) protein/tetratricopeptide (TPR) repeat protein
MRTPSSSLSRESYSVDFGSGMASGPKFLYEFGQFRVDPEKRLLLRNNESVPITPKTFETLLILVRHSREVVSKDDLMKELWPDSFVEEANLSQNIFVLRKALGETPEDRRFIVTLPGKGYQFVAEVRTVTQAGEDVIITSHSREQVVTQQAINVPAAMEARDNSARSQRRALAIVVLLLIAGAIASWWFIFHKPKALTAQDTIVLADFTNTTGDPVFDETLRQGLEVQLEQSPFLSLVAAERIQHTLRLMGQPPDVRLTPELGREVCERTGSAAVLDGSIATLGSQYVLGLRAKSCRAGEVISEEQVQAARKEDVLNALGQMAGTLRTRLGESLATVEQHSTPLAEATTPSLEALKAYSQGWRTLYAKGENAAIPFFQEAVKDDPQFAMAYAALGLMYGATGEPALSADNTSKAYRLRDRASEPERYFITVTYESWVTGNLEKAQQTCETWAQVYPAEIIPHTYLSGFIYVAFGKYEQAIAEARKVIALDPDFAVGYVNLGYGDLGIGRIADAEGIARTAAERKLEFPYLAILRFDIAFLKNDQAAMEHEMAMSREKSVFEDWIADHEAFAAAYSGRLQQAAILQKRASDLAQQAGQNERAAIFQAGRAVWEGFFGNPTTARTSAAAALKISNDKEAEYGAAFGLALAEDSVGAQALIDDLQARFPEDTSVRFSYLPSLQAMLALNHGEPSKAIEILQLAGPYELGTQRSWIHGNFGALYPVYTRGLAYLALHQGAEAAAEFQKILDHRGIVISDPVGAVARLQLARAYAMQGDTAATKAAYQDFLTLWKDADPDIAILQQAKAESAKLH